MSKLSPDGSTLLFSTFIGGSAIDSAYSLVLDDLDNIYITGETDSSDFPTENAYQSTHSRGGGDVFVTKLSADGSELLYSTFIGGSNNDWGSSIVLDSSNNAYLAGTTRSSDFPTVNAYNSTFVGVRDVFACKLSANGSKLLYSTFIGEHTFTGEVYIALDSFNNAYITGTTESANFPTVNAFDSTHNGDSDVFVSKLSSNGSTLLYSTYLGGVKNDFSFSLVLDNSNNVYIAGTTGSSDFPMMNAYDSTFGGSYDVFVSKLSFDGSELLYSTFIGGTSYDDAREIILDNANNAYITGWTGSQDFPMVSADNSTFGGDYDIFISQLSFDGSELLYSTFFGGKGWDAAYSLVLDGSNDLYIAGWTSSSDFPTMNAYDSTHNGNSDVFVTKLSFFDRTTTVTTTPTTTTTIPTSTSTSTSRSKTTPVITPSFKIMPLIIGILAIVVIFKRSRR